MLLLGAEVSLLALCSALWFVAFLSLLLRELGSRTPGESRREDVQD